MRSNNFGSTDRRKFWNWRVANSAIRFIQSCFTAPTYNKCEVERWIEKIGEWHEWGLRSRVIATSCYVVRSVVFSHDRISFSTVVLYSNQHSLLLTSSQITHALSSISIFYTTALLHHKHNSNLVKTELSAILFILVQTVSNFSFTSPAVA